MEPPEPTASERRQICTKASIASETSDVSRTITGIRNGGGTVRPVPNPRETETDGMDTERRHDSTSVVRAIRRDSLRSTCRNSDRFVHRRSGTLRSGTDTSGDETQTFVGTMCRTYANLSDVKQDTGHTTSGVSPATSWSLYSNRASASGRLYM